MLPKEYGPWQTIYYYFDKWKHNGTIEKMHDMLVKIVRVQQGKKPYPTASILDSQSSKTTECAKKTSPRGYDAGKKIKGRKRHILVDTLGLIISVIVHSAGIQDRDGGRYVLAKAKNKGHTRLKTWVDGGYRGTLITWAKEFLNYDLVVVKRSDINKHIFSVLPKRWIGERTFAWFSRYRRLSKDYEYASQSEEAFIYLSMIDIMVRRIEVAITS